MFEKNASVFLKFFQEILNFFRAQNVHFQRFADANSIHICWRFFFCDIVAAQLWAQKISKIMRFNQKNIKNFI
jgi:hypothetical protein